MTIVCASNSVLCDNDMDILSLSTGRDSAGWERLDTEGEIRNAATIVRWFGG